MYCASNSDTESKAGHNPERDTADEVTTLEVNHGSDVRVKRLASLGFHCVGQLDGTVPPTLCIQHLVRSLSLLPLSDLLNLPESEYFTV